LEVLAALERLIASDVLRGSPQLVAFLRFIVEVTLRGEQDAIKGYTIGVEAFGRGTDFDPQLDPIVRVEATRLRRTLERYYAGPGARDPVRIELQPGSYIPRFRQAADENRGRSAAGWWGGLDKTSRRRIAIVAICCLGVFAASLAAFWLRQRDLQPAIASTTAARDSAGRPIAGPFLPGNGLPTVVVGPFDHEGPAHQGTPAFAERLADAFARFDTVNVTIGKAPTTDKAAEPGERSAEYRLSGTLKFEKYEGLSARLALTDMTDGTIAWSGNLVRDGAPGAAAEETIAGELATTLLQPFGVIRARERVKQLATGRGDPRYRCITEASESLRSFVPAQHENARLCLEQLTAFDPSFASGFRYLAAIYMREYLFGAGTAPEDPAIRDRALISARRAVEMQPESSRAYHTLAGVLLARGEIAQGFAAGEKAIALNKYDLLALGDHGGRRISVGDIETGLNLLRQAAGQAAVRPGVHHFYLFVANHINGNAAEAAYQAKQITNDEYPLGHLAQALTAAAAGDRETSRRAMERLVSLRPAWRDRTRQELERFFYSKPLVDRLERDLIAAGVKDAR
jgi:hypothetical protein